ncbi:helix-turn-helix transcriptional regulator [Paenibacillus lutrae]|uniref:WYL domain-containing protein n=1 Tax=Paenibacillus lutrae TaxID=2078573 RepID=A0A7X3FIV7_9BACL|nr:YafY family protein [Paenibacillus lutrae]MVP00584.1 WYL domain-containing protein [Paenibacillus lutrae]
MKIDRLLAMTVLLLNRKKMSAKELADRFQVSTKTIYRDMEALSGAGIPVFAHQGTTGGFEIMEHYTISRQVLSLEELRSLLAAVKGIHTALDDSKLADLLEKVKAMLNKTERDRLDISGEAITFDFNPWGQGQAVRDKVNALKEAIAASRLVTIRYTNMNGSDSEREVEPASLILKGNVWYLLAYCKLRADFRIFRLSRICEWQVHPRLFEARKAPPIDSYSWDSAWSADNKVAGVILIFRPEVKHRVGDSYFPEQVEYLEGGTMRVTGEFNADEWFYSQLLSYGNKVKVEGPAAVVKELKRRAAQIVDQYAEI